MKIINNKSIKLNTFSTGKLWKQNFNWSKKYIVCFEQFLHEIVLDSLVMNSKLTEYSDRDLYFKFVLDICLKYIFQDVIKTTYYFKGFLCFFQNQILVQNCRKNYLKWYFWVSLDPKDYLYPWVILRLVWNKLPRARVYNFSNCIMILTTVSLNLCTKLELKWWECFFLKQKNMN